MPRPNHLGLGKDESKPVTLRVPNDMKKQWATYCETYGNTTANEGLRAVMRFIMQSPADVQSRLTALVDRLIAQAKIEPDPALPEQAAQVTDTIDHGRRTRVELRFTPSEHAKLAAIAEDRKCSVQYWLTSLTRAALTNGITVGAAELKALGEYNYQLMSIGRNLNQITYQINSDPSKHLHQLRFETIREVGKKIDEGRQFTHALVNACSHRWALR